jgi:hypothetical protein
VNVSAAVQEVDLLGKLPQIEYNTETQRNYGTENDDSLSVAENPVEFGGGRALHPGPHIAEYVLDIIAPI